MKTKKLIFAALFAALTCVATMADTSPMHRQPLSSRCLPLYLPA